MQNWLKFTPQTSPEIYYLLRYSIPKFLPERTMINVLLHRCCAARIDSSRKIRPLWLCRTVYCRRWRPRLRPRPPSQGATGVSLPVDTVEASQHVLQWAFWSAMSPPAAILPFVVERERPSPSETLIYLIPTKILLLNLLKRSNLNGGS